MPGCVGMKPGTFAPMASIGLADKPGQTNIDRPIYTQRDIARMLPQTEVNFLVDRLKTEIDNAVLLAGLDDYAASKGVTSGAAAVDVRPRDGVVAVITWAGAALLRALRR